MTDLVPFTSRAECSKCGNSSFSWEWWPDTTKSIGLWKEGHEPLQPKEHLRLKCLLCGWPFAMQPKDAEMA